MIKSNKLTIMPELIEDIIILNNIYDEYNGQSIKTDEKYSQIFYKYEKNLNFKKRLDFNYKKIIGKLYRYNKTTNKLIVPIFYKNNKFYIYYLFINVWLPELNLIIKKSNYYNSQIIYGSLANDHFIINYYHWRLSYHQNKNEYKEYKNENEFIKHLANKKIYNTYEFKFIKFKTENELQFEKRLKILELKNTELINENKLLKEQVKHMMN